MTDTILKVSNTADRIEQVVKESAKEEQTWNTRAMLLQNNHIARIVRSNIWWGLGILETTWDTLYRLLTLTARPQDLKYTGKILHNWIKTILPTPNKAGNRQAPTLLRNITKQRNDPHTVDIEYHDTHEADLSLAPKTSDKRYTKLAKFIPFTAGKVIKAPLYAWATLVWAATDTVRRMKNQKARKLITLDFEKTSRNKTSHVWKKLTSRAYNSNTTDTNTQDTKKEDSDKKQEQDTKNTSEKKSFWSRLWPFGKKKKEKKEPEIKKDEKEKTTEKSSEEKKQPESPKTEENKEEKESSEKETIAPEVLATIITGHAAIKELNQAFENKDKKAIDEAKDKILRAQATERNINKNNLPDEHKALFKEIKSTATDIGQLKYKIKEEIKEKENHKTNKE